MHTLLIKDLARTEDLDRQSMSAVRGGCYGNWKMPSCFPTYPTMPTCDYQHPQYPTSSTTTTTVSVAQANNQSQNNATGNGSAVFGGGIFAANNQQGFNSIG
jgi:hypothetical protein